MRTLQTLSKTSSSLFFLTPSVIILLLPPGLFRLSYPLILRYILQLYSRHFTFWNTHSLFCLKKKNLFILQEWRFKSNITSFLQVARARQLFVPSPVPELSLVTLPLRLPIALDESSFIYLFFYLTVFLHFIKTYSRTSLFKRCFFGPAESASFVNLLKRETQSSTLDLLNYHLWGWSRNLHL